VLVAVAVGLIAVEEVTILLGFLVHERVGEVLLWVGGPTLAAVVGTWAFRRITGRSLWGPRRWRWSDVGWGLAAGVLVLLSDTVLGVLFDLVVEDPGADVQGWIEDALLATPVLVAVGLALATPFAEEVVFRGFVLRGFEARFPTWVAVAVSSLLFGLLHLENLDPLGWLHVISATVAGAIFALALLKAGHLLAAVTAHVLVNVVATGIGLFLGSTALLTVGPAGDLPSIELEVGACARVDLEAGQAVDEESEVDCDEPHDVEVASRDELPGGPFDDVTFDDREVARVADEACRESFEAYVGADWLDSDHDYLPVLPDPDRWEDGERELVCLVVPWADDELTEPARGSGR
jgi:membrane protease YdiL (CAAX protease family)